MRAGGVGLVALWASATAMLTVTAWLAVEVVADEVGGPTTRVLSAAAVSSAVDRAAPSAQPTASSTPKPSTSRSPSLRPSQSQSPRPSSRPTSGPTSKPGPSSPSPRPTPKPSSTGAGAKTVNRTFGVPGGTVAASCTGASVSLRSAQPKDGWRVEVKDRGPEHLEIAFRSGDEETEVKIRCSSGTPVVSETDGASDD
ncbi:MAG TPA: hypothetical protein VEV13_01235 [Candidatus Limnocylindria bacterium]|nr:hypothetical protein [Candidatus Limnocylindria bacterium]